MNVADHCRLYERVHAYSGEGIGDQDNENEDTAYSDDLQIAARAGIRLLEDNAHLTEEIEDITKQYKLSIEEIKTLKRLVDEKENKLLQVAQHIKESIIENQQLLTENRLLKVQIRQHEDRRHAICMMKRNKNILHKKRNVTYHPTKALRRRAYSLSDIKKNLSNISQDYPQAPEDSGHQTEDSNNGFGKKKKLAYDKIEALMRPRLERATSARNFYASHQSLPSSPLWGHSLSAEKVCEDNPTESVDRRIQFGPRHKMKIKLEEANRKLIQKLRTQLEESGEKEQALKEEQAENYNLIESLRNTLQMYQQRGTARKSITILPEEAEERFPHTMDDVVNNLSRFTNSSAGYHVPSNQTNNCSASRSDTNDRIHQKSCIGPHRTTILEVTCDQFKKNTTPEVVESEDSMESISMEGCQQVRLLNEQIATLQQILERYRVEIDQIRNSKTSTEKTNKDLSAQLEVLQRTIAAIEPCLGTGEWEVEEANDFASTASDHTNFDESCGDETILSVLKFFIDSWTTEQTNRMYLHDWLVSALRGKGKRKPLFLNELTPEIAKGFQYLFVPILRQYYGLDVELKTRKRHAIVTDLRLQTHFSISSVRNQAHLQRLHRSMFLLDDIEAKFI